MSPKRALQIQARQQALKPKRKNLFNCVHWNVQSMTKIFNFFVQIWTHESIKEVQQTVVAIERKAEQSNKST